MRSQRGLERPKMITDVFRENRHVSFRHWLFQRCDTSAQTYFSGAWRHDIISARFEADLEQARRLSSFTTRSRMTENDYRFRENCHAFVWTFFVPALPHIRADLFFRCVLP